MVLFDSDVTSQPGLYDIFRPAFLAGYVDGSDRLVDELSIDHMIEVRIEALRFWLDDLSSAPIGIRTSTPGWLETLESFVHRRRPQRRQ